MIRVVITHEGKHGGTFELGQIRINRVPEKGAPDDEENGDYFVEMSVKRGDDLGLYRRPLPSFPRLKFNVMGLIMEALAQFTDNEEAFNLDDRGTSDVARRRQGVMRRIQRRKS